MPTLTRIAPELPALNLQESIRYYVERLGFRLAMQLPSGDYAVVERDDVAVHLYAAAGPSSVGVHIFCPQLDELQAELLERGARLSQPIERKPWGNRDFRVLDPAGNEIKFTEPLDDA